MKLWRRELCLAFIWKNTKLHNTMKLSMHFTHLLEVCWEPLESTTVQGHVTKKFDNTE